MSRSRSFEVYLKPGIEEDDQVYDIWSSLRGRGRPQDVFRRALRLGLRAMAEAGELPRAALEIFDPDLLGAPSPMRALLARGARGQGRAPAAPRERRAAEPAPRAETRRAEPEAAPAEAPVAPARAPEPAQAAREAARPVQASQPAQPPAALAAEPPAAPAPKGRLGRIM